MATWNIGRHRKAIRLSRVWTFRLALIVFVGIGVGVIGCVLLGERLLGVAISNSPMLWFLAIGAGCWQLSLMTHKGLEMTGRPRLMLLCLSVLVFVTVPANFFLIPILGPVAAAASFAFSSVSYCLITHYLSQKMLRLPRSLEFNS
jgi:O-antigen/teichoic acid export membrane protein